MNYYVADTHFCHANIIRLCNRPFKDVNEMNWVMVNNWNNRVLPNDDVYVVGDFGYRARTQDLIRLIDSLNGKKHLIVGNHDVKALKDPVYRGRYEEVCDYKEVIDNDTKIVLFHYPTVEWNDFYKGVWLFFGHIHNNDNQAQRIMKTIPRAVNIGADLIGFTPRTAKELMELKKSQFSEGEVK